MPDRAGDGRPREEGRMSASLMTSSRRPVARRGAAPGLDEDAVDCIAGSDARLRGTRAQFLGGGADRGRWRRRRSGASGASCNAAGPPRVIAKPADAGAGKKKPWMLRSLSRSLAPSSLWPSAFGSVSDARAQAWREEARRPGDTPRRRTATPPGARLWASRSTSTSARRSRRTRRSAISDGRAVTLGSYFDGKRPTLFLFAYHTCPMLCSLVLDATASARSTTCSGPSVGSSTSSRSASIRKTRPRRRRASAPRSSVRTCALPRRDVPDGLPRRRRERQHSQGHETPCGFQYNYDARQKQYAHPAAVYLLTPDGQMARYLYGIEYPASDIRLGKSSRRASGSLDHDDRACPSLLLPLRSPKGKHYALVAMNVMRLGGAVTDGWALWGVAAIMWVRERRQARLPALACRITTPVPSATPRRPAMAQAR